MRYLLHGVLPVVLGAAIYVLLRSPRLRVFDWLQAVGLGDAVPAARAWARPAAEHLPQWLLYSAPDAVKEFREKGVHELTWWYKEKRRDPHPKHQFSFLTGPYVEGCRTSEIENGGTAS
jgi:hypothetical protein